MDSGNHHYNTRMHQSRAGFRHGFSQRIATVSTGRCPHSGGNWYGGACPRVLYAARTRVSAATNALVIHALKLAGAAYLVYLGIKMLRSRPTIEQLDAPPPAMSDLAALRTGFLTNALNPKTSIFIVSLFIGVVRPDTASTVQIAYGLFIAGAHAMWFSLIALCFSAGRVREKLVAARQWIDRIFGGLLVSFGVLLTIAQRSG